MKRDWLKEMREDQGLTQKELGEKLGTTRQAIANIELGFRNPSLIMALKLAKAFEFHPNKFLEEFSGRELHKVI